MLRPSWNALLCLGGLALAVVPAHAVPPDEFGFRAYIADRVAEGSLDFEEALLIRFQRIFSPQDLPIDLRGQADPHRSATMLIHEFQRLRESVSPATAATIDAYLRVPVGTSARVHSTAHFRFTYETTGPNAVAAADVAPANGVPDFVEWIAGYAETSWTVLVSQAGFTAPVAAGGRVPVSFREMSGYGYSQETDGVVSIVLHRSFANFPANSDPDGSLKGAAKVTMAHELKHASQYAASGWTEQGWLEADATWAEDFVFDATNDYLRLLSSGSPITSPDAWLPNGQASYEDCLWQHLLVESHGPQILVDFFARRAAHPAEAVTETFVAVLRAWGSSLRTASERLGLWSYFCGANAWQSPEGFREAALYPTPPLSAHLPDGSTTLSESLTGMSSHYVLVGGAGRAGQPWVQFLGDRSVPFSLSAVTVDRTGRPALTQLPVNSQNAASFEIPINWEDVTLLALVVTNAGGSFAAGDYYLSVDDQNPVGVEALAQGGFDLMPNRPNPFRGSTIIAFSLASKGSVRLAVYDIAGRLVRRIVQGDRLEAGTHERTWDGIDEAGRLAAPGVYYYRIQTNDDGATRKMLLLR